MARTPSSMTPLGTELFDFKLKDAYGELHMVKKVAERPRLLMFICSHCPYVIHLKPSLGTLSRDYGNDVSILAINSNDLETYPQDGPEAMLKDIKDFGYKFPFLIDSTQEIARTLGAACTPDFFLFSKEGKLIYRGQFDESRPQSHVPITGKDLREALDALAMGDLPSSQQKPSVGCNIKWKIPSPN